MNSDSPEQINMNPVENEVAEATTQPGDNAEAAAAVNEANSTNADMVAQLSQQIDNLKQQVEERNTQYMRIAADFENYRKRTQKEKEELDGQIKRNTITELLPVIDNFERARAQLKPQNDGEMSIHKSYQSVYKQLVDCLKRIGVSPMRPEGQPFDPNFHEAVMREPTDEYPEGTVLEELVRGYFLGDRVLRHSMVKVAAPKEDAPPAEADASVEGSN